MPSETSLRPDLKAISFVWSFKKMVFKGPAGFSEGFPHLLSQMCFFFGDLFEIRKTTDLA